MYKKIFFYIQHLYFAEQNRWIHWLPVGIILGASLYFSLSFEPSVSLITGFIILGILSVFLKKTPQWHFAMYQTLGIAIGFCLSFYKVHSLNTQMLSVKQKHVVIQGKIQSIENHLYKESDTLRLVLDNIQVNGENFYRKLRLNIPQEEAKPFKIGDSIKCEVNLFPIPMPCSLHTYFARRDAYLQGVAGTAQFLEIIHHTPSPHKTFAKFRQSITNALFSRLEHPYNSIAAALVTGDRSYIPKSLRQNFVDSGLAHVLAISGLHLSLIAGLIFLILRRLLCLHPSLAMRHPIKKWAAILAVFASSFYLAIANFGIPVQRSFIMIALAMFAVCINRTAFSMRSLAIAAFIVLLFTPESVLSASFQLSFGAVLALLAFYETLWTKIHDRFFSYTPKFFALKKIFWGVFGIFTTTFIASLATTPYSIAFFQRFSLMSILGNILAIPLVATFIMPLGLISVLSLFFGGFSVCFALWQYSLQGLCWIATHIANLPGAGLQTKAVPNLALIIFSYGFLWLCLWKKSWRFLGIIPMCIAATIYYFHKMPFAYINAEATTIAIHTPHKIYTLGDRPNTFALQVWSQEWGQSNIEQHTQGYLWLENFNTLLISSPKEGITFLKDTNISPEIIITFGYQKTLKKYGFDCPLVIDRTIIHHNAGMALFKSSPHIVYLKEYYGKRPWC